MFEQLFIGKIRVQRSRGEKYQRSVGYSILQTILNICLQIVLIAKPLAEVLRFLAVQIIQTDLMKLPVPKKKPLDGCAGDYPSSDYAKGSFKRIGGNMLCCQRGRGGSARGTD